MSCLSEASFWWPYNHLPLFWEVFNRLNILLAAFVHYKMCKVQGERDVGEDVHLAEPGLENLFMRALGYC